MYDLRICETPVTQLEKEVMSFWKEKNIFKQSVDQRPVDNQFVLYDGPPFATGLPHYGHILAHSIKDVFPRYQTMKGKRVERRFGWDCHGVPVEYEVEKQFKINGTTEIEKMGIAEFNEKCRSIVLRFTNEWKITEERLGRFVDMDNDYKTMDNRFMESVWAVFNKLQQKGLIYEGKKIVAYSPELGTPLSDFESKLNYKEISDPAVTMTFPLVDDPKTSLLVWTTTPWSVPTNVAIAVNPSIQYVKVAAQNGNNYILAKDLMPRYFEQGSYLSVEEINVNDLIGKRYQKLFDVAQTSGGDNCYRIVSSAHVTATDGTGLVHISPAHGEDDYQIGKNHDLPTLDFTDRNCVFNQDFPMVQGQFFKDADKQLIEFMKNANRLFKEEQYTHEYPYCWRTDKPLMYRAIPSWYVKVTAIKDRIIENNKHIKWYPDFVGEKRFHNWLESARDWAISRNRYWGCPIPIWRNVNDANDCLFVKSAEELQALTGQKCDDLHRHHIDDLIIQKDNKTYKRIPEVFDCWFESGAMPYAQDYYMFDNEEQFVKTFPADFIAEGIDQTRGWFYTLNVLSTALYDKPAFKNCVVNGILLGNDGKKMSKSKGNYPSLDIVFDKYGADALRFLLLSSNATFAQELAVKESDIEGVVKDILLPMLNIYKFFGTYANSIKFNASETTDFSNLQNPLDKWLIHFAEKFKQNITGYYDSYNLIAVCQEIRNFIDGISNSYIHFSRKMFSQSKNSITKQQLQGFQCLHYALNCLSLCAAPIIPFVTENLYRALNRTEQSIHLQDWPVAENSLRYEKEFADVELINQIIHLGQRAREENNIRTRQPLPILYLNKDLKDRLLPYIGLISQSLNVKAIEWIDESQQLKEVIKLNIPVLGKKYKAELKLIQEALVRNEYKLTENNLFIAEKTLSKDEYSLHKVPRDNTCGAQDAAHHLWIMFNTQLTPELIQEGYIRDFMRHLQDLRKEGGYQFNQIVDVFVDEKLAKIIKGFEAMLLSEINCRLIYTNVESPCDCKKEISLGDKTGEVQLRLSTVQPEVKSQRTATVFENNTVSSDNDASSVNEERLTH